MAVDELNVASEKSAESSSEEPGISDATTDRVLKLLLIAIGLVVVIVSLVALGIFLLRPEPPPPTPLNSVDVGFLQDMTDHHQQALLISDIYLAGRPDGPAASYASEVILFQEREIGWMDDWLADAGYSQGEPDRQAMTWMGMSSSVGEMPGMQSPESLAELEAAQGADADRLFFEMMSDHHLGGVHMAEFEIANGANEEILNFAAVVVRNQLIEIIEYEGAVERLGLG